MIEKRKMTAKVDTELNVFDVPFDDALNLAKIGNGRIYKGAHVFNIDIGSLRLAIFAEVENDEQWNHLVSMVKTSPYAVKKTDD